jgi:tetratricopeptide (TPR) repeat protein
VDRNAGDDPARRFASYLNALLQNVPRLVIDLDNMESLLVGPAQSHGDGDEAAFGQWRSEALAGIWSVLRQFAEDGEKLHVIASCRYRNADFGEALIPIAPLPDDALFRLMGWFPALRRLSVPTRARLVERLAGHPRAVEFANDLIRDALARWSDRHGEWRSPERPTDADLAREWDQLVEPALPRVHQKLRDDLLFDAIWDRVLDDPARWMLYRMTLLRRPWDWDLMKVLGEEEESPETAEATAERLRRTSLLEQVDLSAQFRQGGVCRYTVHPATAQFIRLRFGEDEPLRLSTHRRVGTYLEAQAKTSPSIEVYIEAGHHLFQAGEYDRSCELLGSASDWLQDRGRAREGLLLLEPFLAEPFRRVMRPDLVGRLLGTVGSAYYCLGQAEKAIGYYEQALVIAREIGDRRGEGTALGNLGATCADLGQVEKAVSFYQQALVIACEIGNRRGEGTALGNLGRAYADLGQVEKAIGFYEQRSVIVHEIGDRRDVGSNLSNLGIAYAMLGQVEKAISYHEQALVIDREIGDRRGEGNTLGNLAIAYTELGQVEKAIGYHEQHLVIAREIGDRRGEGTALANLGSTYFALGQVEKAIGSYEQCLVIAREIGDRRCEGATLSNLGLAYAALGQVEKAVVSYEQCLVIAREIGDRRGEGGALGNLGLAYAALGKVEKVIGLLKQAVQIGQEIKDPRMVQIFSTHVERLRGGGT